MNDIVDYWLPRLSNAETRLLWYYFRHAKLRKPKGARAELPECWRNVSWVSLRNASRHLGLASSSVHRTHRSLLKKGAIRTTGKRGMFQRIVIDHYPKEGC